MQNNALGIGVRGSTHYARATNGTVLAERTPNGRFNYLYDGNGSVAGLTNSAGALAVSYRYDAYGHPLNLQSQGNENPFGYLGAYALGLGSDGVLCGGPGYFGCTPYDGENGRLTSPQAGSDSNRYTPSGGLQLALFSGGDPLDSFDSAISDARHRLGSGVDDVTGGIDSFLSGQTATSLLTYAYNGATGCLAGGEAGAGVGTLVANPAAGAVAGCIAGAIAGQFVPSLPYEGQGIPRYR